MYIINYYKKKGVWSVDPDGLNPGGKKINPERTGNFAILLDRAAQGRNEVTLYLDFKPFPQSSAVHLLKEADEGGYYHIGSFAGQQINLDVWVEKPPFLPEGPMPQILYIRVIEPTE